MMKYCSISFKGLAEINQNVDRKSIEKNCWLADVVSKLYVKPYALIFGILKVRRLSLYYILAKPVF